MNKTACGLLIVLLLFVIMTNQVLAQAEKEEVRKGLINFGGQLRLRFDATQNQSLEDFSYTPGKGETQLLNRTRLHVEANPADGVRLYCEPQFYGHWGGYNNEDRLSVYQGYVEFPKIGQLPVTVRVGRQDFVYGSAFFLGNADWYRGLTWDGAKIRIQPTATWHVDLLAVRLVSFTSNKAEKPGLYGFYSSLRGAKESVWDLYFFYNRNFFRYLYDNGANSPRFFTLGTRFVLKPLEKLQVEVEPMYQFGSVRSPEEGGNDQIRTYGGHVDVSYNFALPLEPSLMVSYAFGTGDANFSDNTYREFQGTLYNDSPLFGDTSLIPDLSGVDIGDIRASGMKIFTISSTLKLTPKLSFSLDWHHFTADKTPNGYTKTVGCEADLFFAYELSEKVSILASANHFFTANLFRQATGKKKDVDYFYLQTQIEF